MSRGQRIANTTVALTVAALVLPQAASAHGLVGRTDLPIPRWLFAWAAAVVLVISFVGLAVLWPKPRLQGQPVEKRWFALPAAKVWEVVAGAIGVALFALVVYAGFAGTQTATANFADTWIYVVFWVGVPVASVFLGDVFRAFNPWRAIARAVAWVAARFAGEDGLPDSIPYPDRLGRWPAVAGILGFAWLELVYANKDKPSLLAALSLGYAAVQLVGMSLWGIEAWTSRGDAFSVVFNFYGRIAPLHWQDGVCYRRALLAGLPGIQNSAGFVPLLATMIGTTSFDGFSQGPTWTKLAPHLQHDFEHLGFNAEHALEWGYTVGMIAVVLIIYGLFRLGILGMKTVGGKIDAKTLADDFVHTLVPISFAYVLAHYFSLLAYQGQAMIYLASDPLGHGSDIFGTADHAIDYGVVTATAVWYVQVGALVTGHAAGLTLAHDRALARYRKARDATRSQYWMLAVMVGFTSLGLWLLSAQSQ